MAKRHAQLGGIQKMKIDDQTPTWAWDYYQACQREASNTSQEADDEKLNHLVRLFQTGRLPSTIQQLEQLVDNHLAGHRQKTRRRNLLLEKYAQPETVHDTARLLAARD